MAKTDEIKYLVNGWNTYIVDHPITIEQIMNPVDDFALNFFFKCYTVYSSLSDIQVGELSDIEKISTVIKFLNKILDGKYVVKCIDILKPSKSTFCIRYAINFILFEKKFVPEYIAIKSKCRLKIIATKENKQNMMMAFNEACITLEKKKNMLAYKKNEYQEVQIEYDEFKHELSNYEENEPNCQVHISKLSTLIEEEKVNLVTIQKLIHTKSETYCVVMDSDKLLNELKEMELEERALGEFNYSIAEVIEDKYNCVQLYEAISKEIQEFKTPLDNLAINYPPLEQQYKATLKDYDQILDLLEKDETKILMDLKNVCFNDNEINLGGKTVKTLGLKLAALKKKMSEIQSADEMLHIENQKNMNTFINIVKKCEQAENELQKNKNAAILLCDKFFSIINSQKQLVVNTFDSINVFN